MGHQNKVAWLCFKDLQNGEKCMRSFFNWNINTQSNIATQHKLEHFALFIQCLLFFFRSLVPFFLAAGSDCRDCLWCAHPSSGEPLRIVRGREVHLIPGGEMNHTHVDTEMSWFFFYFGSATGRSVDTFENHSSHLRRNINVIQKSEVSGESFKAQHHHSVTGMRLANLWSVGLDHVRQDIHTYSLSVISTFFSGQASVLATANFIYSFIYLFFPACKIHLYNCDLCHWTGSRWVAHSACMSCKSALWCLFSHQETRAEEDNSHSCSSF